ncbi:N-acetyl-1-D-myo-inositol-2-amino-2-deoxy-alpha-D-glucopyranoside deacetylase [Saccharopolyspora sp. HNM0983]|uniref:N-acetyl-1-D-myo-inositol-2-amino-2-deoxy-alpha-D-glucopyranoside deacetylase n=1 Tax=Saccharopolyspora montiporae TaxID=2781240 RepID=A0A929FZR8_9PSEU|nr:N-acetyl-1-D-myo-inositol-2-amino-2-deoxy-alpha-D-glucopyranoside deacetylase [Saccharopolyspora sp. HNM0983]MBE9374634.1 N-acetyl-1-D-myo-inositol-2-amino-2-deoxy-alpha-D-glucopyranoside deacetylase [Saccharopolyspora sp. HNM0983]
MLVHAHPDDESTATGATIARYCAEGADVGVVTCTSGELGEVVADDLAALRGDPDALGEHRRAEISAALAEYGDVGLDWLGGPGRWRDSGMAGADGNSAPGSFSAADPVEIVRAMVGLLRRRRPHVLVTYDDHGGYGHPDHIAANRAVMDAIDPAADPAFAPELGAAWSVPKVYWTTLPDSLVRRMREAGIDGFAPHTVPDEQLTAVLDGRAHHAAKLAALRHYRSQVDVDDGGFFSGLVSRPEFAVEHYLLVRGVPGPGEDELGRETDLFAGLG